jgi:hypothetical protein
MKPHEREMEKIESRLDAITDQFDDEDLSDSRRATLEEKMRGIEAEMRRVEEQMRVVEREMERVEREIDKHHEVADKRFEEVVMRAIRAGKGQRVD